MGISKIGNTSMEVSNPKTKAILEPKTSVDRFKEYMEKTPQEILFEAFLKRNKLTEEEFSQLSAIDRESLLQKFEDELKQKAGL